VSDPRDDDADLELLVEAVCEASREHLAVIRGGADEGTVEAAYLKLNNASAAYDERLFDVYDEVTPWQADTLRGDDLTDEAIGGDGMMIAVRQRRDFVVPDVAALLAAGTRARAQQGLAADDDVDGFDGDTDVTEVGEAVYEIVQAGGGSLTALDIPELESHNGVLMVNAVSVPLSFVDDPGAGEEDLPFVVVPDTRMLLRIDEEMVGSPGMHEPS
jgi:hypothetical protein